MINTSEQKTMLKRDLTLSFFIHRKAIQNHAYKTSEPSRVTPLDKQNSVRYIKLEVSP